MKLRIYERFPGGKDDKMLLFLVPDVDSPTPHERNEKIYGNPYSKFATLHGMIEAYDFVHQWTSDGGQLTSSDVRLMIDGMVSLRYTSLL